MSIGLAIPVYARHVLMSRDVNMPIVLTNFLLVVQAQPLRTAWLLCYSIEKTTPNPVHNSYKHQGFIVIRVRTFVHQNSRTTELKIVALGFSSAGGRLFSDSMHSWDNSYSMTCHVEVS